MKKTLILLLCCLGVWAAIPSAHSQSTGPLQAVIQQLTPISCFGGSNGSIQLTAVGGTPPYQVQWANGDTNAIRSGLPAGTYLGYVTDSLGVVSADTFVLQAPAALVNTVQQLQAISCAGGSNGAVQSVPTGGTPPYSYFWAAGDTTSSRFALPSGTYVCTVTDSGGCQATDSLALTDPPALSLGFVVVDSVRCQGQSTGTVQLLASGGVPGYAFTWANGDTSSLRTAMPAGWFTAFVTDSLGCTKSDSILLTSPTALVLFPLITQPISCFGGSNGEITLSASGGKAPYLFFWGNGDTTNQRTGLPAGTYFPFVKDANGCQTGDTVTLTAPARLRAGIVVDSPITCAGLVNGAISATASGGTGPYSVVWANGDTARSRSSLPPGSYQVIVTDANGCTSDTTLQLIEPDSLILTLSSGPNSAFSPPYNGFATVSHVGGTGPVNFAWTGPEGYTGSSFIIFGLNTGMYIVTATDSIGCVVVDSVLVGYTDLHGSVQDELAAGITEMELFPNPAEGLFTIRLELDYPETVVITVQNLHGQRVALMETPPSLLVDQEMDLRHLPPGTYLAQVTTSRGTAGRKILLR